MPYITQEDRRRVDSGGTPQNPGDLNYILTGIILSGASELEMQMRMVAACAHYLRTRGGMRYQHANDAVGALFCAALEYDRRTENFPDRDERAQAIYDSVGYVAQEIYSDLVGPYEDSKIAENGDLPYA